MVISLYKKRGGEQKSSAKASCNDLLLLAMLLLPLLSCSLSLSCWPLAALAAQLVSLQHCCRIRSK